LASNGWSAHQHGHWAPSFNVSFTASGNVGRVNATAISIGNYGIGIHQFFPD
jgi:hypothetical protein